MKIYKDKQFLIFDYEDGRTVKYDFASKQAIGIKGNPVKNLKNQLSGMTIDTLLDCFEDKQYAKFLSFIKNAAYCPITNIGTILERVPKYSNYEQIFSAGIEEIIDGSYFRYTINEIPKSLIKLAQIKNIKLSNTFLMFYKNNPNAYYLAYKLDYLSLNDNDIFGLLTENHYDYNESNQRITKSYFNTLIDDYGYNAKSLLLYLDELKTFEAIENIRFLIQEIFDYAKMMKSINPKFDKYPRHFLSTHKIACRNFNRLKKEFDEISFKNRINKDLEFTYGDYKFVYPQSTEEIKREAVEQNNCVASYIDSVIEGKCHILFLRKKKEPDKSLVTLEVRNNKIVQARRRFNDPVLPDEQIAINKWNEFFKEDKEEEVA